MGRHKELRQYQKGEVFIAYWLGEPHIAKVLAVKGYTIEMELLNSICYNQENGEILIDKLTGKPLLGDIKNPAHYHPPLELNIRTNRFMFQNKGRAAKPKNCSVAQ